MKLKKPVSLVLAAVMACSTVIFASVAGVTTVSAAPITITWATQPDTTAATKNIVAAFNKSQSKYQVKIVYSSSTSDIAHDTFMTSLNAKSSDYDVMSLDVCWAGEFASAGYLAPIDAYMKSSGLKATDFNAGSMAAGHYGVKQYTLPFFPDLGILFFRTDIVSTADAAKLASGNYTWNDLYSMATKYDGKSGTKYGYVYQAAKYEGLVCNLAEFTQGFKTADIQSGLQMMQKFTSSKFVPANITTYQEQQTLDAFIGGQSVFARNWPYMYGSIQDPKQSKIKPSQVGFAPLPKDGGDCVGGWVLGINQYSKNKDAAWAFVNFVAGQQGQEINATVGGHLPGLNASMNDPAIQKANSMLTSVGFQNAVKHTVARPISRYYSSVSDNIQNFVSNYLAGGATLAQTTANVKASLNFK